MRPITYTVKSETFSIKPVGCLHYPIGDKALLKSWVDAVKKDRTAYVMLMGDTLDSARTHYRDHLRSYRADQTSQEVLDDLQRGSVRDLAEIIRPIKDRVIGAIRGNHYWEFQDGTNSEQLLCKLLGITYLGALAMIRIRTPKGRKLVVYAHHTGGGGGITVGGDINTFLKQEMAWDADIYLAGHTHKRLAFKVPTMHLTDEQEPKIVERTKMFVRCGAMLQGFKPDYPTVDRAHEPSYAELKAYRPTDLGWVTVSVSWKPDGRPE